MSANSVVGPHGSGLADTGVVAGPAVSLADLSFGDVLRAINPLQYLPVVGTIYRVVTGDTGSPGLRTGMSAVIGLLSGGPVGLIGSICGALAEHFLHVESLLREAVAPASQPPATAAPTIPEPTHARAEADLGRLSVVSPAPSVLRAAASAYHAAGLLGSL